MNRWMKIWWMPLAAWTAMGQGPAGGGAAGVEGGFERGLVAEEAAGDLQAAKASYAEALAKADAGRAAHASTLFRLAEVQRRLGEADAAAVLYRRLLAEFADQAELASVARTRLASGGTRVRTSSGGGSGGTMAGSAGSAVGFTRSTGLPGGAMPVSGAGTDPLLNLQIEAARQRWLRLEEARTELILKRKNLELRRKQLAGSAEAVRRENPPELLLNIERQLLQTETRLAGLRSEYGPEHPETRKLIAEQKTLHEQLDRIVEEEARRRIESMLVEDKALQDSIDSYAMESAGVRKELEVELDHAAPHSVSRAGVTLRQQPGEYWAEHAAPDSVSRASVPPVAKAGGSSADAARFLDEEIQVAEEQLAIALKSHEAGRAGQEDVLKARREVLALKRQRASARPDIVEPSTPVPTPTPRAAIPALAPSGGAEGTSSGPARVKN